MELLFYFIPSVYAFLSNSSGLVALSAIIILVLCYGHVLEGAETGKHASTDPSGVLSVKVSEDVDVRLGGVLSLLENLVLESLLEAWHHGGATSKHNVIVKIDSEVRVALVDRLASHLVDTRHLFTIDCWQIQEL